MSTPGLFSFVGDKGNLIMARGRMIDRRVSKSKKIAAISSDARSFYFMMYPFLDRDGMIAFDDLDDLKVEIFTYFHNYKISGIIKDINELADIGLLDVFPYKNKIAFKYFRFSEFQTLPYKREAASEVEAIPDNSREYRITPDNSGSIRILASKFKVKIKEVKGRKEGSSKVKIHFDFEKKKFLNITEEDKAIWKDAYPKCDIEQELLRMRSWLIADPKRVKIQYKKFINNWLARAQDQGGTKGEVIPRESWPGRSKIREEIEKKDKLKLKLHEIYRAKLKEAMKKYKWETEEDVDFSKFPYEDDFIQEQLEQIKEEE